MRVGQAVRVDSEEMSARDAISLSKFLSLVLRHDPGLIGMTLREGGWAAVDELLEALAKHGRSLSRAELESLVRQSDKQRFAFSPDGTLIRASQGHSVPVELGYEPTPPPSTLFHGTIERYLPAIRRDGLLKGKRHHVHLSATRELATVVGRRRGAPVVLVIAAAAMAQEGHAFFCSANGVWLTDHVPVRFISS
jgi:putative RNA 2'-phosphotransferase